MEAVSAHAVLLVQVVRNGVKVRAETLKNGRKTYEMRKIGDDIYEAFSLDGSNKTLVKKNGKDLNTYER